MSEKIGHFQVLGELGQGAHSTILHIRRNADGKQYALKIVKIESPDEQKYVTQAEHEFEVAQKLDHPNLIKIYLLEKVKSFALLGSVKEVKQLIEFVNGRTLDRFKSIPVPILLQVFRDVASGLATMHGRNIYHGDIKPSNIMLSKSGQVRIIDYGLAWIKGQEKNRVQGTPEYMSPEQMRQRIVNEKTDLFNFGATLYRLLAGQHIPPILPIGENSVPMTEDTWKKQLKPVLSLNPKSPQRLAQIVEKCLMWKPAQRPDSMMEVFESLEGLVQKHVCAEEDQLPHWEWE
jgi:serine/threonine protein kinase